LDLKLSSNQLFSATAAKYNIFIIILIARGQLIKRITTAASFAYH